MDQPWLMVSYTCVMHAGAPDLCSQLAHLHRELGDAAVGV
jgi:hypothetical protein